MQATGPARSSRKEPTQGLQQQPQVHGWLGALGPGSEPGKAVAPLGVPLHRRRAVPGKGPLLQGVPGRPVLGDNPGGAAYPRRPLAGSRSFGHHRSKHFPWDDGFLLCLAATQGCLNFSQRQIFIRQSVQCSAGQA